MRNEKFIKKLVRRRKGRRLHKKPKRWIGQWYTNFPKLLKPLQNFRSQEGDMKIQKYAAVQTIVFTNKRT